MSKIEEVARAISNVALWSRMNDWTSDRVEGFPVEICRYGLDDEPEIIVVRRFPTGTNETEALTIVVAEERAKAAIEALRDANLIYAVLEPRTEADEIAGRREFYGDSGAWLSLWNSAIDVALKE